MTDIHQFKTTKSQDLHSNKQRVLSNYEQKVGLPQYSSRWERLKNDCNFRRRIVYIFCLIWAHFPLGWIKGQIGPALPDIQHITKTNLEQSSAFLTSFYIGKIAGSASGGFGINRFQPNWLISTLYGIHAFGVAIIPWMSNYIAAIGIFFITGVMNASIEIAIFTCSARLFSKTKDSFTHVTQLTLSVSSIISPLAISPFLMSTEKYKNHLNTSNTNFQNRSVHYEFDTLNLSVLSIENETCVFQKGTKSFLRDSEIFIPFSITAAVMFATTILFVLLKLSGNEYPALTDKVLKTQVKTSARGVQIVCLINVCLLGAFDSALEVAMGNVLSVFLLQYLNWQPAKGAFAISLFFFTFMLGRMIGIFLSRYLKPIVLLGIHTALCVISFAAFLCSSYLYSAIGIWVSTALGGFAISAIFPSLMSWLFQTYNSVSQKLSLFLTVCYVGSVSMAPILGVLMENVQYICFAHTCVVTCILIVLSYIMLVIYNKDGAYKTQEEETKLEI